MFTLYVKPGFMAKAKEFFVLLGFWRSGTHAEDILLNGDGKKIKLIEYTERSQRGLCDKIPYYVFSVNDIHNVVDKIHIWLQEFCADDEWEIFVGSLIQYKLRVKEVFWIDIGLNPK